MYRWISRSRAHALRPGSFVKNRSSTRRGVGKSIPIFPSIRRRSFKMIDSILCYSCCKSINEGGTILEIKVATFV